MLELALHLEKSVINLKMDALRLWNIALAGTACGNLLSLIENSYGYPETRASVERGSYLETLDRDFAENAPNVEPTGGTITKEADAAESQSSVLPPKRRKKSSQGPDKVRLAKAAPIISSTSIHLHQTGVLKTQVLERKGEDGQSIYRCNVRECEYITAQFEQACTHVRRKHLSVCIKCCLCNKRSFRSVDIQKHYNVMHHDQEVEWFEPIPTLEGDIIKITEETLKANIALVKKEVLAEEEEDDDDNEPPDVPPI